MSWTCGKVQVRRGQIKRHKIQKAEKSIIINIFFERTRRSGPQSAARLIKLSELSDSEYVSAKLIRVGL